jgi:hypothetical protein
VIRSGRVDLFDVVAVGEIGAVKDVGVGEDRRRVVGLADVAHERLSFSSNCDVMRVEKLTTL